MNILLISLFSICSASNILVFFPLSPKSHVNSFMPVFNKLSQNGHNLTMYLSFKPKQSFPNSTIIIFENFLVNNMKKSSTSTHLLEWLKNPFFHWPAIWKVYLLTIEKFLEGGYLQNLIKGENSFDLVMSETLYLNEIFVVLGHIYKAPVINLHAHWLSAWPSYLSGSVMPYSFVPNNRLPVTHRMTFTERVKNSLINLQEVIGSYYYYLPAQEELMRKYLCNVQLKCPSLLEMLQNTSLTLLDAHYSYGYIRPHLPNMIEVGGLTVSSLDKLDEEYQKFMDEANNGVIYFSFGSMINNVLFPAEKVKIFLSAFGKLNQRVIMKWNKEDFTEIPRNVKVSSWLPQNEILAHPNCHLFISHGGIHGMTEAIYHRVPLVVFPLYSDQHFNAKYMESQGFAYVLNHNNLTVENLLYTINAALENQEFRRNIERRSVILKDKALSAEETAVYWVEYVLRHRGAKHLRPASLDLNFFQYFLLDIILSIFIIFLICCYVGYYLIHSLTTLIKQLKINIKQKFE